MQQGNIQWLALHFAWIVQLANNAQLELLLHALLENIALLGLIKDVNHAPLDLNARKPTKPQYYVLLAIILLQGPQLAHYAKLASNALHQIKGLLVQLGFSVQQEPLRL